MIYLCAFVQKKNCLACDTGSFAFYVLDNAIDSCDTFCSFDCLQAVDMEKTEESCHTSSMVDDTFYVVKKCTKVGTV